MNVLRPAGQRGFTLIEVMAAFAMFALMFGVILQILSTSMTNTRRAGDYTQAALWAQTKLDTVGLDTLLEPGATSGQFDERYSWTMEVEEVMSFDDSGLDLVEMPYVLYEVRLAVEWGDLPVRSAVFRTLRSVDRQWAERQRLVAQP